jgi:hypothetical protein
MKLTTYSIFDVTKPIFDARGKEILCDKPKKGRIVFVEVGIGEQFKIL